MQQKRGFNRYLCLLVLMLLLAISLTGCKSKKAQYQESLTLIVDEISAMNADIRTCMTALQTALSAKDAASYGTALSQLKEYSDTLKSKYQALAAVEAPEEFTENAARLKSQADILCTMLDDSIELYTIAGEAITQELTEIIAGAEALA
mgnify:CR=1 FL=1